MNRFRTKKKARDHVVDPDVPTAPSFFKKGRKGIPESKTELDLTTALPSSDDFRTSLLMPNLSARFSMLREQDDPSSKLGKASDDSVLFPKRQSRMNLFTHNPLSDIAEDSSINESIRPPFAFENRSNSVTSADGYGTDDDASHSGSIMARAKPGEGNNLFGGRQKIYKIPVGGSSSRNVSSPDLPHSESTTSPGGKAMYEDDVTLSMFQKLKQQEREERRRREPEDLEHQDDVDHEANEPANSPLTGFSRNRGTSSSTTSGPSNKRTSTAATSIDSQTPALSSNTTSATASMLSKQGSQSSNLERNGTKARRMYGAGLDQTMQQSPALSRLENLNRQRALGVDRPGSALAASKSTGNLNDKYQKAAPVYASTASRTASPPPSATPPGFGPMDSAGSQQHVGSNHGFGYVPPLSPPISEGEDVPALVHALQPEDRGKATAMGLFNKPSRQYDEQQFSQRQLQMHEGRNTPTGRRPSEPTQPIPEPSQAVRPRNQSNASFRSRDSSLASRHEFGMSDSRKAALQIAEARMGKPTPTKVLPGSEGTFLEPLSDPNSDVETETPPREASSPEARRPPSGVHPALREPTPSPDQSYRLSKGQTSRPERGPEESPISMRQITEPLNTDVFGSVPSPVEEQVLDSPTLGPAGGLGLSGLVRTHMRTDSDKSSIQPPPSPRLPSNSRSNENDLKGSSPFKSARTFNQPESTHSNPWEFDDIYSANDTSKLSQAPAPQINPPNIMSIKARQILGQAAALKARHEEMTKQQQILGEEAPRRSEESAQAKSWQEEMRARHQRGGSTETQKEREDFEEQLAERRRIVQEKLKSFAKVDSRSNSPVLSGRLPEGGLSKAPHPFAMLRAKSSKTGLVPKAEPSQSKAMKMLGLGNATMSSTSPKPGQEDLWRDEEEKMLRDFAKVPRARSPHPPPFQRSPKPPMEPPQSHVQDDESKDEFKSRGTSPPSSKSSHRDRSSSEVSGRLQSRTGRYRDDLEQAMEEGTGSINRPFPDERQGPRMAMPPRPSVDTVDSRPSDRSASAMSGRFRSDSRAAVTGYFDSKGTLPIQTNDPATIGLSPRPSPITPYSANSTPPLVNTPPVMSVSSTPTLVPPTSYNNAVRSANLASRKKSVNKALISEPTFLSSTYSVSSVADLPLPRDHGQSPPIPPMNPRRRRGTNTQTLFGAFSRKEERPETPTSPFPPLVPEERSTFSDEGEKRPVKPRQRLRKSSSEGGNLNAKARQQAMMMPSPAVPQFPQRLASEGGMF